jgi:hypothetical protein
MATVLSAGGPIRKFSPNSKQFAIEEKYLIQAVEEGTVQVFHRSGSIPEAAEVDEGFMADAMTKPLQRNYADHYFRQLQGYSA